MEKEKATSWQEILSVAGLESPVNRKDSVIFLIHVTQSWAEQRFTEIWHLLLR
jgi:hypothetical protein